MKRNMLVVVLVLVLCTARETFAQGAVGYGAKAGLNISTLAGKDAGSPDSKSSLVFGAFLDYNLAELFTFHPEALYISDGAVYKGFINGTSATETLSGAYLQIPLVLKLNIPLAQGVKSFLPNIYAGPYVAFLLSAKDKVEAGTVTQETDIKDNTKGTDIGLVFGTSADIPLTFGKFAVDLRYNLGLSSVDDTAAKLDLLNRSFAITVGFAFK